MACATTRHNAGFTQGSETRERVFSARKNSLSTSVCQATAVDVKLILQQNGNSGLEGVQARQTEWRRSIGI
jgi:hypothetical protein